MLARAFLKSAMFEAAIDEYQNLLANYSWGRTELATGGATLYSILGVKIPFYLGQAYEQIGQNDKAVEHYETFLKTWEDADEELTTAADVKQRLAQLKGDI